MNSMISIISFIYESGEKVIARYDPHRNPEWGVITPPPPPHGILKS